jgi:hypothetical protein
MQTHSTANVATTSLALTTPAATITEAASEQSLPPGVTVVDTANGIQRLDWSPSGKLLAVLTLGWELGLGRADILDLTGRRIASFDAFDMAWVDDSHLMTLVVSPNDTAQGTATVPRSTEPRAMSCRALSAGCSATATAQSRSWHRSSRAPLRRMRASRSGRTGS